MGKCFRYFWKIFKFLLISKNDISRVIYQRSLFRKEYREFLGEEDIINLSIFLDKRYVTIRKIIDWSFLWYAFNSCLKADAYRGLKLVVSL